MPSQSSYRKESYHVAMPQPAWRAIALLTATCISAAGWACSGPDPYYLAGIMAGIERYASLGAALTVALFLVSWLLSRAQKRFRLCTAILLLQAIIHPAWTTSAFAGDCGGTTRQYTFLFGLVSIGVITFQVLATFIKPRAKIVKG
jgi:hypothetical protein